MTQNTFCTFEDFDFLNEAPGFSEWLVENTPASFKKNNLKVGKKMVRITQEQGAMLSCKKPMPSQSKAFVDYLAQFRGEEPESESKNNEGVVESGRIYMEGDDLCIEAPEGLEVMHMEKIEGSLVDVFEVVMFRRKS